MYAVIRAGGKQYRVAPGDVIRVEKVGTGTDGQVEFPVVAVSGEEGQIGNQSDARVVGKSSKKAVARRFWFSITNARSSTRNCADIASHSPRFASPRSHSADRASRLPSFPRKKRSPRR